MAARARVYEGGGCGFVGLRGVSRVPFIGGARGLSVRAERKAPEDGGWQPDSDSAPSPGRAQGRGHPLTGGPQATVKEREMTGWAERGKETGRLG